jgi:hypothetical protein
MEKTFILKISDELDDFVRKKAFSEHISKAELVRRAIKGYLENES